MEDIYKAHKVILMPAENGIIVKVMYCENPDEASDYMLEQEGIKKKYTADKSVLEAVMKAIGAPMEITEMEDEEEESGEAVEVEVKTNFDPSSFKPKKYKK